MIQNLNFVYFPTMPMSATINSINGNSSFSGMNVSQLTAAGFGFNVALNGEMFFVCTKPMEQGILILDNAGNTYNAVDIPAAVGRGILIGGHPIKPPHAN